MQGVVVAFRDTTAETEEHAAIQKELAALTDFQTRDYESSTVNDADAS